MLRFFSVAEAHGLIYPRPSGENFNFAFFIDKTLKDSLNSIDTEITTQDELEELAVTLSDKVMKAVDISTPETYRCNDPKSPINQAIVDLIK